MLSRISQSINRLRANFRLKLTQSLTKIVQLTPPHTQNVTGLINSFVKLAVRPAMHICCVAARYVVSHVSIVIWWCKSPDQQTIRFRARSTIKFAANDSYVRLLNGVIVRRQRANEYHIIGAHIATQMYLYVIMQLCA